MSKANSGTVYAYVRKDNAKFAKSYGRKVFGSESDYIDTLISLDRGIKPKKFNHKPKI